MSWGIYPVVLVFASCVCALTRGDTVVSCDLKSSCVLPCRFQAGDEEVIHWIQEEPTKAEAHSYYYKKDQLTLQNMRFQNRTMLFLDQLSTGNASLQLKDVTIQDEGRYKCYTSTTAGHDQIFIQLHVDAPILKVDVDTTGNRITCSSEGIYPKPELSWSTEPPSSVSLQQNAEVRQNEKKLYVISSSLDLASNDLNISCTVQTRKYKRKTTRMKYADQVSSKDIGTNLSCTLPATPQTNLIWKFNQSEDILSQDLNKTPVVTDRWKEHFVGISESGSLKLKDLTIEDQGLYTCEASNAEETIRSDTQLIIEQREALQQDIGAGAIAGIIISVVLVLVPLAALGVVRWRKSRSKNKRKNATTNATDKNSEKNDEEQTQLKNLNDSSPTGQED